MALLRTHHRDSGIVIRTVSAVVFLLFTFLWIYYLQSDLLAYAQHLHSGGRTQYYRLPGALLITAALWLLQLVVYSMVRLRNHLHALTYFPSMLCLGLLGGFSAGASFGLWRLLLVIVLLVLWGGLVWVVLQFQKHERPQRSGFFSRSMWVNLLLQALMMVSVVAVSSTSAVLLYRAHVETCLQDRRFDEALLTGSRSLESDAHLTMLRAYALSRRHELGERLFHYAVSGTSADLVPGTADCHSRLLRYPQDSIYRHLGAIPRAQQTTAGYLQALQHSGQATTAVADYVLCGQLIDRDLDAFARTVTRYYTLADSLSLPRHYREALVLYRHLRSHPVVVYRHAVTDEDYRNLQELEAKYSDPRERKIRVLENYQGSYWYYYEYMR